MSKPSRRAIAEVVASLMDKGEGVNKLAKQLAAYLLSERRTKELEPLMRDVIDIRAAQGTLEATAISARELSGSTKSALKKLTSTAYPNAKNYIIHEELDRGLVSGLLLGYGENQLDLSARGRLKQLKLKQ